MSWWGKVIGGSFGFMFGGPLGALAGMAVGHQFDKGINVAGIEPGNTERVQLAFFTATFSVMGYLAKADGKVSSSEIQMAENIMRQMNLNPEQRKSAITLFNKGKQDDFDLDGVLSQFKQECHRRINLLQMFLEILIATAFADNTFDKSEQNALQDIAVKIGFNAQQLDHLIRMVTAQQYAHTQPAQNKIENAYAILGVDESISDAELKKVYRRLMSQHHPDKLVAKGLPEEMIKLANDKTGEIKSAYEQIKNNRK